MKKRTLVFWGVISVVVIMVGIWYYNQEMKVFEDIDKADKNRSLREMDAMECYHTLLENGLVIPDEFIKYEYSEEKMAEIVKYNADYAIENEGEYPVYNGVHNLLLAARVSMKVMEYEGIAYSSKEIVIKGLEELEKQYLKGKQNDKEIKLDGYDYISTIYYNQRWKYDSEELGCEVYEWSEDIVLPMPRPEGGNVHIVNGSYCVTGIDRDEWNAYVDIVTKKYGTSVSEIEGDGWYTASIGFGDWEKNFYASVSWHKSQWPENMSEYCTGDVFVGSNYRNTKLSNSQVVDKILEMLNYDKKDGFSAMNVSSETNYKDGFDVYLVGVSAEYATENDCSRNFVCALKDDEIVLWDSPMVSKETSDSVEFLKTGDTYKAYITETIINTGSGGDNLIEYELVDGKFERVQKINISSIAGTHCSDGVVLRKNDESIDVLALERNGSMETTPIYGWYKIGDKVLVIDKKGVKKPETK